MGASQQRVLRTSGCSSPRWFSLSMAGWLAGDTCGG
jgi:hypothetical protein